MNEQQLAEKIDQLIGNAEVEKALDTLIDFLDTHPKYRNLEKAALNARSLYKRTRDKELKGTISNENATVQYAVVQNNLLDLVDKIKRGDISAPTQTAQSERGGTPLKWLLPIVLILALAGGGYWYFKAGGDGANNDQQVCPPFSTSSDLNVLLLPFQNLSAGELRPEIAIKDRLSTKCREYQVPSDVAIFERFYELPKAQFPDFDDAASVAQRCNAKLIVWGTVERLASNRIDVNTKFKYLGPTDAFELDKIQVEGQVQVDTLESVSSIARQGSITKDIEKLVLMLFGIVAHEQRNYQAAAEALEQTVDRNDTSGIVLRNMLLADSYLKLKKTREASRLYDEVLEVDPDLELARNNRATIEYEQGNYAKAVDDFTKILERNPDDEDALAGRGAAYLKLKEIRKAEEDIDRLKRVNPKRKVLDDDQIRDLPIDDNLRNKIIGQSNPITDMGIITTASTPRLFEAGDAFVIPSQNKVIELSDQPEEGQTLIFAGRIPKGSRNAAHQIKVPVERAIYRFQFKTKDGSPLFHQIFAPDGKTLFRDTQADQSMVLRRGKYNLQVYRENTEAPLYYEVRIELTNI